MSILETTLFVYENHMDEHFYVADLVRFVRKEIGRPYLMDGTVTRRLRELKGQGRINYKVLDSRKAFYKKIKD